MTLLIHEWMMPRVMPAKVADPARAGQAGNDALT
jgi:hypothetical protein